MKIELSWEETEYSPAEHRGRAQEAVNIRDSVVFKDAVRYATTYLLGLVMQGEDANAVMGARSALHGLECIEIGLDAIIGCGAVAEESEENAGE